MILSLRRNPPAAVPTDAPDERQIMQRARRDPAQFAPLYEHYYPRVYAYCRRRVDSIPEAEDLCSQVFVRALSGLHTYRGGMVAAWLFRIAHNVIANHYRGRRATTVPIDDLEIAFDGEGLGADLERAEDGRILARLIGELPDEKRDLLALMLDGGLTSEEVGAVIGKRAGAVRVEFHRIIKRLRKRYAQVTGEDVS